MTGAAAGRPTWVRHIAVPASLDELAGPVSGLVGLPRRLFWSGNDPGAVRWDRADRNRRRDLYEIVLAQGDVDDARRLVNRDALLDLWDDLYLPPWVSSAWGPLISSANTAA